VGKTEDTLKVKGGVRKKELGQGKVAAHDVVTMTLAVRQNEKGSGQGAKEVKIPSCEGGHRCVSIKVYHLSESARSWSSLIESRIILGQVGV